MKASQTSTLWSSGRHSLGQVSQKLLASHVGFLESDVNHRGIDHGFTPKD